MIQLNENAVNKLLLLKNKKYLQISCLGGGCSGLKYHMEFIDDNTKFPKIIFQQNELIVVTDNKSWARLFGTILNYDDSLNGKGFEFINPNAITSCGCGQSFSAQ